VTAEDRRRHRRRRAAAAARICASRRPPVRELQQRRAAARQGAHGQRLPGRPADRRRALDAGAQVVITGRCVDSAVTLGALMHDFGWTPNDFDRLAGGSLAGHIIECGCQATGGLHTDWDHVPDWAHIGYPIVECRADGSFTVAPSRPAPAAWSAPATVAEQMLYEIGDPAAYLLPDVVCDFTPGDDGPGWAHRVRVHRRARRAPAPASYKVSATYVDGFKTSAQLTIVGFDAVAKARRTGEAILDRAWATCWPALGLPDYSRHPHRGAGQPRRATLAPTPPHLMCAKQFCTWRSCTP
jgi:hypothetical protein